jgi:hypothetical protein
LQPADIGQRFENPGELPDAFNSIIQHISKYVYKSSKSKQNNSNFDTLAETITALNRPRRYCGRDYTSIFSQSCCGICLQLVEDLCVLRKPSGLLLGKDQLAVGFDLENTAAASDQFHFDTRFFFDFGRQTGSPGKVVSLYTVFNGNVRHGFSWVYRSP